MNRKRNEEILREFEELSSRLIAQIKDRSFYRLSYSEREHRINQLRNILKDLVGPINKFPLPQVVAASAILLLSGCQFPNDWYGIPEPEFAAPVKDPFGLVMSSSSTGYFQNFGFADIDGDGDLDFYNAKYRGFASFYSPYRLLNTGSASSTPHFDMASFSYSAFLTNMGMPYTYTMDYLDPVDIDADGDLDVFSGFSGGATLYLSPNTSGFPVNFGGGSSSYPTGISPSYQYESFSLVDIDADGDFDFMGVYNDSLIMWENIGTPQSENFSNRKVDPFGFDTAGSPVTRAQFVDIDGDGDQDVFFVSGQNIIFKENTGTVSTPVFGPNQSNISTIPRISRNYSLSMAFADIDGDGDKDLFILDRSLGASPANSAMYFFENITRTPKN